jgi:hypothetical protein
MTSLAEMRAELRELRKSHPEHKPVSKMRKADISSMIQKLKVGREETPAVATASPSGPKMYKSASEGVKKAKAEEFPLEHHSEMPKAPKTPKAKAPAVPMAKKAMVSEKGAVVAKPRGKKTE